MGQFCIDQQLGHALTGDVQKGLFFRGSGALPFGDSIRSVKELMVWLMSGHAPMHHNSRNG
jgi:nitronate monooxygenase